MEKLSQGDPFPDLVVASVDGLVALEERWKQGPLVVAFMRHFGWPFCREHLVQLEEARDDIRAAGGDVVAIFQYRPEPTRNFCRQRKVTFDCLGDPTREAYREVGLDRYKPGSFVGPSQLAGIVRAARKGSLPGIPKGDVAQAPGTFVVAPGGTVAFAHYNEDSADHPSMDAVMSAVRSAKGQTGGQA